MHLLCLIALLVVQHCGMGQVLWPNASHGEELQEAVVDRLDASSAPSVFACGYGGDPSAVSIINNFWSVARYRGTEREAFMKQRPPEQSASLSAGASSLTLLPSNRIAVTGLIRKSSNQRWSRLVVLSRDTLAEVGSWGFNASSVRVTSDDTGRLVVIGVVARGNPGAGRAFITRVIITGAGPLVLAPDPAFGDGSVASVTFQVDGATPLTPITVLVDDVRTRVVTLYKVNSAGTPQYASLRIWSFTGELKGSNDEAVVLAGGQRAATLAVVASLDAATGDIVISGSVDNIPFLQRMDGATAALKWRTYGAPGVTTFGFLAPLVMPDGFLYYLDTNNATSSLKRAAWADGSFDSSFAPGVILSAPVAGSFTAQLLVAPSGELILALPNGVSSVPRSAMGTFACPFPSCVCIFQACEVTGDLTISREAVIADLRISVSGGIIITTAATLAVFPDGFLVARGNVAVQGGMLRVDLRDTQPSGPIAVLRGAALQGHFDLVTTTTNTSCQSTATQSTTSSTLSVFFLHSQNCGSSALSTPIIIAIVASVLVAVVIAAVLGVIIVKQKRQRSLARTRALLGAKPLEETPYRAL